MICKFLKAELQPQQPYGLASWIGKYRVRNKIEMCGMWCFCGEWERPKEWNKIMKSPITLLAFQVNKQSIFKNQNSLFMEMRKRRAKQIKAADLLKGISLLCSGVVWDWQVENTQKPNN